jgi:hypothetical protein
MRPAPFEASKQFINKYFPECHVAVLAGSAARGNHTVTSDLDIVIIDNTQTNDYRESFVDFGWRIEAFVYKGTSYRDRFSADRKNARPVLACMLIEGIVIKDNGSVASIKQEAQKFLINGPEPLTKEFINASRYFMFDLLDDFKDSASYEEALMTLSTISIQFSDFILRVNGQWSGRGKTATRALFQYDKDLAQNFFDTLSQYYQYQNKEPFIRFVDDFYKSHGGPLFEGFSMGK